MNEIRKDDDDRWRLFCQGERGALEYFYKKYYNLLFNYGLKLLNEPLQIQDYIQDIFYRLCKREQLQEISNLKVYLLKAMRNIVYDYYARRKELVCIDEMDFAVPEDDGFFDTFFSKDDDDVRRWKFLLAAINELPAQQKQVLYLYYVKGLSHKEISEIMEINPQSSMNALSKSVSKLRFFLNEDTTLLILFFLFLK